MRRHGRQEVFHGIKAIMAHGDVRWRRVGRLTRQPAFNGNAFETLSCSVNQVGRIIVIPIVSTDRCFTSVTSLPPVCGLCSIDSPIFALHKSALICFRFNVQKSDVPVEFAKQGNTRTNQNRYVCESHFLNQSSIQKCLYCFSTVNIYMTCTIFRQSMNQFNWRA